MRATNLSPKQISLFHFYGIENCIRSDQGNGTPVWDLANFRQSYDIFIYFIIDWLLKKANRF